MRTFLMLAIVLVIVAGSLSAAAPTAMNYQGLLTDAGGSPVADASYSVVFTIYDAAALGDSKWTETQSVTTSGGLFAVLLGSVNPIMDTVFNGATRYLGITVGANPQITPRTALVSVPYSFRTATVDGASGGNIMSKVSIGAHLNTGLGAFAAGDSNTVSGKYSTASGGYSNAASGRYSSVSGGLNDTASGDYSNVGGGENNIASSAHTAVAGGLDNTASSQESTVGGGRENLASGYASVVSGGNFNIASGDRGTIPGGHQCEAAGSFSFASGLRAKALHSGSFVWADASGSGTFSSTGTNQVLFRATGGVGIGTNNPSNQLTVSGNADVTGSLGVGMANPAAKLDVAGNIHASGTIAAGNTITINGATGAITSSGSANKLLVLEADSVRITGKATIGNYHTNSGMGSFVAGDSNQVSGIRSTVSGGYANAASGDHSSVGGGQNDTASGDHSTIGGGFHNIASYSYTAIGGGQENVASFIYATVAGGTHNEATGQEAAVGGGGYNIASGHRGTIPGGSECEASGQFSFASGLRAKAMHQGSFVWADASGSSSISSTTTNQFSARTAGGARFFTNHALTTGVQLAAGGGAWASVSDRNVKENIRPVDGDEILEKISQLDITRWNYETQDASIEHIGPMAQDFYELFGVGDNNTTITTIDPDGISLAAIKALIEKNDKLESEVSELKKLVGKLIANQN